MSNALSHDQLMPRLQVMMYVLSAFAVLILMYDQYRQGLFTLVLSSAIAVPTFLFAAIFVYINRDHPHYVLVNYALVMILAVLALYQLPYHPMLMTHYLYALPLFGYFCLPLYHATFFNIIFGVSMTAIIWWHSDAPTAIRSGANYALLIGSSWCFAYLTHFKSLALKRLSLTDLVSGAYNRRHFYQSLTREVARAEQHRQPFSLIMLVIDDYAQLHELHGERALAVFLPQFVRRLQMQVRAGDDAFRVRDDCFVLLLPNCREEGAIILLERIKRHLQQPSWPPLAPIRLSGATVTRQADETGTRMEQRLTRKLEQQRQANLQLSAFADQS